MNIRHFCYLECLLEAGGSLGTIKLGVAADQPLNRGYYYGMTDLLRHGLVTKPYAGMYCITERGRIAHALWNRPRKRRHRR